MAAGEGVGDGDGDFTGVGPVPGCTGFGVPPPFASACVAYGPFQVKLEPPLPTVACTRATAAAPLVVWAVVLAFVANVGGVSQ